VRVVKDTAAFRNGSDGEWIRLKGATITTITKTIITTITTTIITTTITTTTITTTTIAVQNNGHDITSTGHVHVAVGAIIIIII